MRRSTDNQWRAHWCPAGCEATPEALGSTGARLESKRDKSAGRERRDGGQRERGLNGSVPRRRRQPLDSVAPHARAQHAKTMLRVRPLARDPLNETVHAPACFRTTPIVFSRGLAPSSRNAANHVTRKTRRP